MIQISVTLTHDLDLDKVSKFQISNCYNFLAAEQNCTKFGWYVQHIRPYQKMQ